MSSYFDLVRATLVDLVPKALMRFMVQHSQRGMQQHLIATLYRWVGVGGCGCRGGSWGYIGH